MVAMVALRGEILLVVARRGERCGRFGVFFTSQRSAFDLFGLRKASPTASGTGFFAKTRFGLYSTVP